MGWYTSVLLAVLESLRDLERGKLVWEQMALKTGQLTTISNDPAAVQSTKGDSAILQKKQSIKGDSSILQTRRGGIASLSRETLPYSKQKIYHLQITD